MKPCSGLRIFPDMLPTHSKLIASFSVIMECPWKKLSLQWPLGSMRVSAAAVSNRKFILNLIPPLKFASSS